MHWCSNLSEFSDFLSYVAAYAPDEFPDEDGDRLDLDSAFRELEYGMQVGLAELRNEERASQVRKLVTTAKQLYVEGNDVDASCALIEAQYLLRGKQIRWN